MVERYGVSSVTPAGVRAALKHAVREECCWDACNNQAAAVYVVREGRAAERGGYVGCGSSDGMFQKSASPIGRYEVL